MTTVHACPRLVTWISTKMETSTIRAKQSMALAKLFEGFFTGFLVWVYFIKINQVHKLSFPLIVNNDAMTVPKGIPIA